MVSPAHTTPVTKDIRAHGQSVWLDFIERDLITSGRLQKMVRDGWITGVTSNPTIFARAIAGSPGYDGALRELAASGVADPYEAFLGLAAADIRAAADILKPVYLATAARDGYVSLEVPPQLARDSAATIAEAVRLFERVGRPNVMIKVPGTPEGAAATQALIAERINVNVTLLFGLAQYERAAEAYLSGLEARLASGGSVARVAGVASFFVSRVDTAVDAALPAGSALLGTAAVANARIAYERFRELFAGDRWAALASAGAIVQRPLWASTGTKNPAYSDVKYVEELIASDTVNTMPEATLMAMLDHGIVKPAGASAAAQARRDIQALASAGVDLDAITLRLQEEGLRAFAEDFDGLLESIASRLGTADQELPTRAPRPKAARNDVEGGKS